MTEQSALQQISILILSARPKDLVLAQQFLGKRNFLVTVLGSLREGVAHLARHRPDWVFVSINLSSQIEPFAATLKNSFSIEPILYTDDLSRSDAFMLEQMKGHVMVSKLTGPSIQLKISQILKEKLELGPERFRVKDRPVSGVRRSSYDSIYLNGTKNRASHFPTIHTLRVLVVENDGITGYQVKGLTQNQDSGGPLNFHRDELPNWDFLMSQLKHDSLSFFLPSNDPVLISEMSSTDSTKAQIRVQDIPTQVPLPTSLFVHLIQNQKFVRLIKIGGKLNEIQKRRLIKAGLRFLYILKEDLHDFNRFYVGMKLAQCSELRSTTGKSFPKSKI